DFDVFSTGHSQYFASSSFFGGGLGGPSCKRRVVNDSMPSHTASKVSMCMRSRSSSRRKFHSHVRFSRPLTYTIRATRSDRSCASWLSAYHDGLRWEDGMIPYNETKRLITAAVFEDHAVVYVKGREKRTWLLNLLLDDKRERMHVETLDAVCEDMESSTTLDNTMRYGQHVKHCALQNVFKIYNWWLQKSIFK
ncbi:hypothetical protein ALC57_05693, partial [Trachymyrmex cornetzi]